MMQLLLNIYYFEILGNESNFHNFSHWKHHNYVTFVNVNSFFLKYWVMNPVFIILYVARIISESCDVHNRKLLNDPQ